MIKVAHITTSLATGGAQMMLYKLLSSMDRERYASSVVSLMDAGRFGPMIKELGVPVYTLNMRRGLPGIVTWSRLIRLARRLQPDIVQGWMYHGNLAALVMQKVAFGHPSIAWNIRHSIYDLALENRLSRLVIKLGARFSSSIDSILYNSAVSAQQHEALGYHSANRLVIPNGFDLAKYQPSRESRAKIRLELGVSDTSLLVGIIGRAHPMKDQAGFVQAALQLLEQRSEVHFLLAGPEMTLHNPMFSSLLTNERQGHHFHFLGERSDIPALMSAMDIFVLSSAWGEGFPNVVGEAMACGLPCVVTDVGDSARILGDCGIVVPPRDINRLAEGMAHLLAMSAAERDELGRKARKRAEDEFSLQRVTDQYEAFYERIVNGIINGDRESHNSSVL
ncbi:MAG: glycosyltransferase [Pseudomonadota bacterium]